jgi:hypothetical protein
VQVLVTSTKVKRAESVHAGEVIELLELLRAHEIELGLLGGEGDHIVVVREHRVVNVEGFPFRKDIYKGLVLLEQGLVKKSDKVLASRVRGDEKGSTLGAELRLAIQANKNLLYELLILCIITTEVNLDRLHVTALIRVLDGKIVRIYLLLCLKRVEESQILV